jgi:hypothetical protein
MNECLYFTFCKHLLKLLLMFFGGFVSIIVTVGRKFKELLSVNC